MYARSLVKFYDNDKPRLMDEVEWVLTPVDGTSTPHYVSTQPVPAQPVYGPLTPEVMTKVGKALDQGTKIVAIKEVKFATNWSLKEAKDFVDWLIVNTDLYYNPSVDYPEPPW